MTVFNKLTTFINKFSNQQLPMLTVFNCFPTKFQPGAVLAEKEKKLNDKWLIITLFSLPKSIRFHSSLPK